MHNLFNEYKNNPTVASNNYSKIDPPLSTQLIGRYFIPFNYYNQEDLFLGNLFKFLGFARIFISSFIKF